MIWLTSSWLAGCEKFNPSHKPYTPFPPIAGPAATALPAHAATQTDSDPTAPIPTIPYEATVAPRGATRWPLNDRTLQAPEGMSFRLGLPFYREDHPPPHDTTAWLLGSEGTSRNGELWHYGPNDSTRQLAGFPGSVPVGPGCDHGTRLTRTGPQTVTLDILATCRGNLLPRSPVRSLAVYAPYRQTPLLAEFRAAAAAQNETLHLSLDTHDLDADGRDDLTLHVGLKLANHLGNPAAAEASFRWIDRAAGLSRDTAEPQASLLAAATRTLGNAASAEEQATVAGEISALRRLFASICLEGGTPRLFDSTGAGLRCGNLDEVFEVLTEAEVRSSLAQGDPVGAMAALQRHPWYGVSSAAAAERFIDRKLPQVGRGFASRKVLKVVPLKAIPLAHLTRPHYSPLSFHADGSLLVLTSEGTYRATPDGRFEYDASSEVAPWPTAAISRSGQRLNGVAAPCDGAEIALLQTSREGLFLPPVTTQLLAPRPGQCTANPGPELPAVSVFGWEADSPSVAIGLSQIGPRVSQPPPGSPTSPNGDYTVLTSRLGLLVIGGAKPSVWRLSDPAFGNTLRDCVINNNAQAAACVSRGRAYVLLPDPG